MKLEGTQSLITGASSGIGLAVAKRLIAEGSHVHSFDIQCPKESVPGLTMHPVDIRKPHRVTWSMREITGKLQILFSNAGVLARGGLFEVDTEEFRRMFEVNVLGSWLMLKTALKQKILAPGATVVQMCSTVGRNPAPKLRPYSLTKQMVHAYIEALRKDHPELRVKGVYPGAVKTPMTMAGFATKQEYDAQAIANWGIVSTADDVAERIIELLHSDANDLVWDSEKRVYVLE